MSQTNLSNDDLFMICITHELKTIKALANHLNKNTRELYQYVLKYYPTLMKEVNATLFSDDPWWDDAYEVKGLNLKLLTNYRYNQKNSYYISDTGIVLCKLSTYHHGISYSKHVKVKLSRMKSGTPIVNLINNTTTSLPKLVALYFMEDYDPTRYVYTKLKGDYSIENLYQLV